MTKQLTVTNDFGETVTIKVGEAVWFKSDIEQGGLVTAINGSIVTVTNENGFEGHYIGGTHTTTIPARSCSTDA